MAALEFNAIACDKDGTLVEDKTLTKSMRNALDLFKAAGGTLILATGETVKQLADFSDLYRFDLVVAENGALLYWPREKKTRLLTTKSSGELIDNLQAEGLKFDSVGEVVVSSKPPNAERLAHAILDRDDWTIIRNRDEVMALPIGIDKGSGVKAAIAALELTADKLVGMGDAENDIPLLMAAGIGVTLSSGEASVKEIADAIIDLKPGSAVIEIIDRILCGRLCKTT
jgi:hydroxymethylpyrimidine pyrophosphatase-like HAD family hydrolase